MDKKMETVESGRSYERKKDATKESKTKYWKGTKNIRIIKVARKPRRYIIRGEVKKRKRRRKK